MTCCSTQAALAAWASADSGRRAFTSAQVFSFRLAIVFLLNFGQVLPQDSFCLGNVLTVEAIVGDAGLVTTDENDRVTSWIEGVEDPHRVPVRLGPELAK